MTPIMVLNSGVFCTNGLVLMILEALAAPVPDWVEAIVSIPPNLASSSLSCLVITAALGCIRIRSGSILNFSISSNSILVSIMELADK